MLREDKGQKGSIPCYQMKYSLTLNYKKKPPVERCEVNFGINFATFVFLKGIMAQTDLPTRRIKRKGKE